MKDHVLVTGGAGYLGAVCVSHLLETGFRVTVVDNLMYGQRSLLQHCANVNFDFFRGDVRDDRLMKELLKKADIIIPLAAIVGAPACDKDPISAQSVNLESIRFLNQHRGAGQLVIYPTTNSGYGTQSGELYCTEETPLEPISLYGQTKVQAEKELLEHENTITLRLATVFGVSPRMRLDLLVNHFVNAAVTDGYIVIFEPHFKRNYIHIRDVADCFLHCIENAATMAGKSYNAGLDDANLSKEELARKIKSHLPDFYLHFSEIGTDPDQRNYIVSNERLRKSGFEAQRSIDDGIVELIKCYRMLGRSDMKNV